MRFYRTSARVGTPDIFKALWQDKIQNIIDAFLDQRCFCRLVIFNSQNLTTIQHFKIIS